MFGSQFGNPRGVLGWLAGWWMDAENAHLNDWVVGLLAAAPAERVLEVGFGTGRTALRVAGSLGSGSFAGVDTSPLMVRRARRRLRRALPPARLDLRLGSAEALPFAAGGFDAVYAVNTVYFWDDLGPPLREMHRVLRRGGRLAIGFEPEGSLPETDAAFRVRGEDEVRGAVEAAGFREAEVHRTARGRFGGVCVTARGSGAR